VKTFLAPGLWPLTALLVALLGVGMTADARELPEIEWQVYSLPPLYILEGLARGQGVLDQGLHRQLIPRLDDFRHRINEVPLRRLEVTLKAQANACAFGLFKNEAREAYMVFSTPMLPQLPPGLMVRRADADRLKRFTNPRGQLSLLQLLDTGRMSVGFAQGRSYGAAVDSLILAWRSTPQAQAVAATTPARNLLQMAELGRVDAVLMLPYEARHLEETEGLDFKSLRFVPLVEQPRELVGHVACAKGPFGEAVIQRVNEILARAEVQAALSASYERWLDDDSRALARQLRAGR
jgi:uncharacterized protein (TIGR02285 family)